MSLSKNHFSSFTMADFSDSMKKFGSASSTFFHRAKQYTEEQLGKSEATVLDARFMALNEKADRTKCRTEQLLSQTTTLLQPNIGARAEEYLLDKLEKKKPERNTHLQTLGQYMRDAGHEFGPGTSYGSALVKVGTTEQSLGQSEKEFMTKTDSHFLHPLRSFLEGDMKTIQMHSAAAKNKNANSLFLINELDQAEQELRVAQAEFDRQYEVTKLLLDGINTVHILTVYNLPGMDNDWMMGERGRQRGKVPVTYLELLD
ncbi:hypothetical protein QZH41_019869 [Actinostola sp. cb2023]|nr:hypothetical protein QZH41_019869 [Actinostola sp. cb2023]